MRLVWSGSFAGSDQALVAFMHAMIATEPAADEALELVPWERITPQPQSRPLRFRCSADNVIQPSCG